MKVWVLLAVLGSVGLAGMQGWRMGYRAAATEYALSVAEAQRKSIMAAERAGRAETARLIAENERAILAQSLEDAANADPAAATLSLRADSVRRLNQR
ncbi:hypothetical protein [Falsirhodobacter sp. alg1]|uniref:hypothetical protein n=1 Tax=Falsirhodobacter sp. alg1 TaxID=1472418 RepID=UPI0005EE15D8|nr:hypothetical protein [Falsirhodobacter sp. alg1]